MSAREESSNALMVAGRAIDKAIAALALERDEALSERDELAKKLAGPCGSCHPCGNWADETWRAAGRRRPGVSEWDETVAERDQFRASRHALARTATRLRAERDRALADLANTNELRGSSAARNLRRLIAERDAARADLAHREKQVATLTADVANLTHGREQAYASIRALVKPADTSPVEPDPYGLRRAADELQHGGHGLPMCPPLSARDNLAVAVWLRECSDALLAPGSPDESGGAAERQVAYAAVWAFIREHGPVCMEGEMARAAENVRVWRAVDAALDALLKPTDLAPEVLTDEPGPEVTEVWDGNADHWVRVGPAGWICIRKREQPCVADYNRDTDSWATVMHFAPITARRSA